MLVKSATTPTLSTLSTPYQRPSLRSEALMKQGIWAQGTEPIRAVTNTNSRTNHQYSQIYSQSAHTANKYSQIYSQTVWLANNYSQNNCELRIIFAICT